MPFGSVTTISNLPKADHISEKTSNNFYNIDNEPSFNTSILMPNPVEEEREDEESVPIYATSNSVRFDTEILTIGQKETFSNRFRVDSEYSKRLSEGTERLFRIKNNPSTVGLFKEYKPDTDSGEFTQISHFNPDKLEEEPEVSDCDFVNLSYSSEDL